MAGILFNSGPTAARLGISKRTLLRAVKRGDLRPAAQSPGGWLRFSTDEIEAYARRLAASRRTVPPTLAAESRDTEQQVEPSYRLIAELASDYAYCFAVLPDGTRALEWMSGAYEALTGYSLEEMRAGALLEKMIHPDDLSLIAARVRTLLSGEPASCEFRIRTKSGDIVWVRDKARPLWNQARDRVESIVGAARDITSEKSAEREARRGRAAAEELLLLRQEQMREAGALDEVSAALAGSLDPGIVYQVILDQAARVLPFDHAEISLYQDDWVVSVATLGGPYVAPETQVVRINRTTSTWRTLADGQAVYLADTAEVPGWTDPPPWCGPYRVRSVILSPLLIDGVLIGSFKLNSYSPHFYTEHHMRRASAFAERATQAVRNARLYAAEHERALAAEELAKLRQEQAEESNVLAQVGEALLSELEPLALYEVILRQSTRVLPSDQTNLLLYQDGWVVLAASAGAPALPIGTRICHLLDGAPFWQSPDGATYLPDTALEPAWRDIFPNLGTKRIRSIIAAPLRVDGVVVGTFDVCSTTPNFYTERHVRLADIFAGRVAQALRNARLYAAEQAARLQAEQAEANLRAIVGASPVPIVTFDLAGLVQSWNAAAARIFGWQAGEALGRPAIMVPDNERAAFDALRAQPLQGTDVRDRQARWSRRDGSLLDLQFSLAPLQGAEGNPIGTIAVFADITARKRLEETLLRQAQYDALTGLPNRTLLLERLEEAFQVGPLSFALLLLDLDNFKEVNDTLGHQAGDTLLHEIGMRLQARVGPTDTVARLGGDEFAVLLPEITVEAAAAVAEKLLTALAVPCALEDRTFVVRASLGIALSPSHGHDTASLLRKADVAMYLAKGNGGGFVVYQADQDEQRPGRPSRR
jgi:diguanylate cyclase (GGDEF)-like protein/PAS domain S-box-containing protein